MHRCTHSRSNLYQRTMTVAQMGQRKKDPKRYQGRDLLRFEVNQVTQVTQGEVKQLIRPTDIRWNSVYDCAAKAFTNLKILKQFLLKEDHDKEEFWTTTPQSL